MPFLQARWRNIRIAAAFSFLGICTPLVTACQGSAGSAPLRDKPTDQQVSFDSELGVPNAGSLAVESRTCVSKGGLGVRENFACYLIARTDNIRFAYTSDDDALIPGVVKTLKAKLAEGGVRVEQVRKVSSETFRKLGERLR